MVNSEFTQDAFSKETNIQGYEKMYKEIDNLLFHHEVKGLEKSDSHKKDSSRK